MKSICFTSRLKFGFWLEETCRVWCTWENTTPTFDSHVIRLCTLKPQAICVLVRLILKSHWSRTTFLISDGICYSRKGSKMSCPRFATRSLITVAKLESRKAKYAVLDQIKLRMLELSVRRSQGKFCTFIFVVLAT